MKPPELILHRPDAGKTYSAVGDLYTFLATGEQTGGAYCLADSIVTPGGGPPPHLHTREEESFYVVEGEITFQVNGEPIVATPGTFVQVPRGVPHAFRNNTSKPARMLIQCTPAGFENFMMEFASEVSGRTAAPIPPSPAEIQKLIEVAPKYGIQLLPPPGK